MRYERNHDLFFTIVDGELIIMDSTEDKFLTSNAVAAAIWTRLETPAKVEELCATVSEQFFGADAAQINVDVTELIISLKQRSLIHEIE